MLTRKAIPVALTLLLLLSFGPASYARGWVYLGEAHVDGAADHDKIKVGRSDGRFRAIQIKVDRAPVEFNHVVVHYGNGTNEEIQVRQKIRAGGSTRDIDLRGGDRVIESVEFWYEKARWRERRPTVELYGRR